MKLCEIVDTELPTTVGEYIKKYNISNGAFCDIRFDKPNLVSSWEGTPFMGFQLSVKGSQLNTLEGLAVNYFNQITLLGHFDSYKNIHKHIKQCDFLTISAEASNLLGALLCTKQGDDRFQARIRCFTPELVLDQKLTALMNELHKLGDIHEAQERLIEAGYEKQAKL